MLHETIFRWFSGKDSRSNKGTQNKGSQKRHLRLEALEERALLAVTGPEFDAICLQCPGLNLSANMGDYNIIEITANELTDKSLREAIQEAIYDTARTTQDDLIVVRVDSLQTDTETDVKALRDDVANDPLRIDINVNAYGGIWIVAFDELENAAGIDDLLEESDMIVRGDTFFNNVQYHKEYQAGQSLIGLDDYYNDPLFANLKGTGYTTVIIDSGIYYDHNDFLDDYGNSRIVYSHNFADDSYETIAYDGHGTHVSSIAAGRDYGIAQDANIIMLKLYPNPGNAPTRDYESALRASLQWVIDNTSTYNIKSVNMSFFTGEGYCIKGDYDGHEPQQEYDDLLNELASTGIIVAAGTGNDYQDPDTTGIVYPAASPYVISVSSVWAQSGKTGVVVDNPYFGIYTSIPYESQCDTIFHEAQRYPGIVDILAPGALITAAWTNGPNYTTNGPNYTEDHIGTSMATPVVAGAAVLAQQVANTYLGRDLTVEEFRCLLDQTGVSVEDDLIQEGLIPTYATYQRIDIYALAQAIYNMSMTHVVNTNDSGPGSLREAILYANAGDTITFASNLNGGTITLDGEQLAITKDLIISAANLENGITIDADEQSRVFRIQGSTVTLVGLTITGGYMLGEYAADSGGGIYSTGSTLTIIDCTISGNTVYDSFYGGGIYSTGANSALTITGSTISGNSASDYGGGIYSTGTNSTLTITDSTISGNRTSSGGGIYRAGTNSTLTITDSTISGNTAGNQGGGIYCTGTDSTLTLTGSTISGNTTGSLGGLFGGLGGGIYNETSTSTLTNCTISGNNCGNGIGGGIYNFASTLSLYNTIVANNTTLSLVFVSHDVYGTLDPAGANNLIGDGTGMTGLTNGTNGNIIGTTSTPVGPGLGPLQDNGGKTWTHALLSGSPAIDAGNNLKAVDANDNPLLYDQRGEGFDRIFGGTVDIGAYEYQGTMQGMSSSQTTLNNAVQTLVVSDETTMSFPVIESQIRWDARQKPLAGFPGLPTNDSEYFVTKLEKRTTSLANPDDVIFALEEVESATPDLHAFSSDTKTNKLNLTLTESVDLDFVTAMFAQRQFHSRKMRI